MKRIVLALVATVAMGSAIAQSPAASNTAAVIHADAGVVQVNGSAAAVPVDTSVGANVDDMVTVTAGQTASGKATAGKATVTYDDGCKITVLEAYEIAAVSPCKAGLVTRNTTPVTGDGKLVAAGLAGIVAVGLAVGGSGGSDKPSSP